MLINVLEYGADPTGVEDSQPAFTQAIDSLIDGGTILVPEGTYWTDDYIVLADDIKIVGQGKVIMTKTIDSKDYVTFYGKSNGKGYGAGGRNITIENLIFKGSFTVGSRKGNSITLHHTDNITIKNCIFSECVINGHCLDLLGCSNVIIENCEFRGQDIADPERSYVEAIQLDHSTQEGNGANEPDTSSYDGLASINITIKGNRFIPLTIGSKIYPSPNPVGSHSRVVNNFFSNISFCDNYVENSVGTEGDTFVKGWMHFTWSKNVFIKGNTFINTSGTSSTVISTPNFATAFAVSDVADRDATKVSVTPFCMKNMQITNNYFGGFDSELNQPLINVYGHSNQKIYAENILISENIFEDNFPLNINEPRNVGSDLISANYVSKLIIKSNQYKRVRRLLAGTFLKQTIVSSNTGEQNYWNVLNIGDATDFICDGNSFSKHAGGFYLRDIAGLRVTDNSLNDDISNTTIINTYSGAIAVKDSSKINISGNEITGKIPAIIKQGINIYGNSSKGNVINNVVLNFPTSIFVSGTVKEFNNII